MRHQLLLISWVSSRPYSALTHASCKSIHSTHVWGGGCARPPIQHWPLADMHFVLLSDYSRELHHYMLSSSTISLAEISQWETDMVSQFDVRSERKWREGNSKMSFNYLLLDPRTTKNLPSRLHMLGSGMCMLPFGVFCTFKLNFSIFFFYYILDASAASEAFKIFLSSIFYIGKGKKTRPYQHFIDAIRVSCCYHAYTCHN